MLSNFRASDNSLFSNVEMSGKFKIETSKYSIGLWGTVSLTESMSEPAIKEDEEHQAFRAALPGMVRNFFTALFANDTATALQYVAPADQIKWATILSSWCSLMRPPATGKIRGMYREPLGIDMERIRVSIDITMPGATSPTLQIWTMHAIRAGDGTIRFGANAP